MLSANVTAVLYVISAVLFILALRGLSSPETSRQGNFLGMTGMAIAIATTLLTAAPGAGGLLMILAGLGIVDHFEPRGAVEPLRPAAQQALARARRLPR